MNKQAHIDIGNITAFYFLGIGGIGMSALARYCHTVGYQVAGYDRAETRLTDELMKEGIMVNYSDSDNAIPDAFCQPTQTIVVMTPAIPADNKQLKYFQDHEFRIIKRAELLGDITRSMKALCVAGTHGKTTTSTMLAHLIYQSDINCNAFLGGISSNYGTNLLLQPDSNYVVVEADEFDRSFLQLTPYMTVVTSVDPDHLDIYGDKQHYQEGFEQYCQQIVKGGTLLLKQGLQLSLNLQDGVKVFTYGVIEHDEQERPDFYADNIQVRQGSILFDFHTPSEVLSELKLGVPVYINIENAVAALSISWLVGVENSALRLGIASFSGTKRRFNIVKTDQTVYIDDYAHHPTELKASIKSLRTLYPDKQITGIFQPHLYTRTRDFADQFAEALSMLDEVILLPIYPAREKPIEGVSSEMLLDKIHSPKKRLVEKKDLLSTLKAEPREVIATLGAGDIEQFVEPITRLIQN